MNIFVGRIVMFYEMSKLIPAIVTTVWDDRLVNLRLLGEDIVPRIITSVPKRRHSDDSSCWDFLPADIARFTSKA